MKMEGRDEILVQGREVTPRRRTCGRIPERSTEMVQGREITPRRRSCGSVSAGRSQRVLEKRSPGTGRDRGRGITKERRLIESPCNKREDKECIMTQKEVIELLKGKKYDRIIELLIKEQPSGPEITSPFEVYRQLLPYTVRKQESFLVMTLDGSHQTINVHEVTKGIANRTLVHPREVFVPAIEDRAVAIIIAHNHPSGKTKPSEADLDITRRLIGAGTILGIPVLDHVIVGRENYASLKEEYPAMFAGVNE